MPNVRVKEILNLLDGIAIHKFYHLRAYLTKNIGLTYALSQLISTKMQTDIEKPLALSHIKRIFIKTTRKKRHKHLAKRQTHFGRAAILLHTNRVKSIFCSTEKTKLELTSGQHKSFLRCGNFFN